MVEEHVLAYRTVGILPCIAGDIEKGIGAEDIGAHKGFGTEDGAVHMAFRGEVDDRVDLVLRKEVLDKGAVADVALHKKVPALAAG